MKAFYLVLILASILFVSNLFADDIEIFGHRWTVERAADWSVAGGELKLLVTGQPPPGLPRRPQKFAIAQTEPFRSVTIEAEVHRDLRSMILVYAWQEATHYNYAHLSSDDAVKQPVHNGMFHVYGGERVRISPLDGPASLPSQEWTPIKLSFDGDSGRCYVEVDGKRNPSLDAYDLSLRHGRVGLGSFNETGAFRKVRITGKTRTGAIPGHQ